MSWCVNDVQQCEPAVSGESMTCPSPQLSNVTRQDVVVDVSFKMDDVPLNGSSFQLHYVRDPTVLSANTSCTALPGNVIAFLLDIHVCSIAFLTQTLAAS